jgi:hypothetical protein
MKPYCLYRHFNEEGLLLYVGVTLSPLARLAGHRTKASWFPDIATITIERFQTKQSAVDAEWNAILFERPKFNKNGPTANYEEVAVIMGWTLEETRQFFKRPAVVE